GPGRIGRVHRDAHAAEPGQRACDLPYGGRDLGCGQHAQRRGGRAARGLHGASTRQRRCAEGDRAEERRRRGHRDQRTSARAAMPAKAPDPAGRQGSAKRLATSSWPSVSTFTENTPASRSAARVRLAPLRQTRTSLGSSETEVNEFAVLAWRPSRVAVATTVT